MSRRSACCRQPSRDPEELEGQPHRRAVARPVERISYVLRIFRLLQEHNARPPGCWRRAPSRSSAAGRPIDVMCLEDIRGLRQVAQSCTARRCGGGDGVGLQAN